MSVQIETLGTVVIRRDGRELPELVGQPLRCALLVYLAVEGEVQRDALVEVFWPDRPAARARHSLNQAVYALRRQLGGEAIETMGERIRAGAGVMVDAVAFERAVDAGRYGDAVTRYRGEFLGSGPVVAEPAFETWVEGRRTHYGRLHRRARRARLAEQEAAGEVAGALETARGWVEADPLDDEAQHELLSLLVATGHRGEAIRRYETFERELDRELGVRPVEQTRELMSRLRSGGGGAGDEAPDDAPVRAGGEVGKRAGEQVGDEARVDAERPGTLSRRPSSEAATGVGGAAGWPVLRLALLAAGLAVVLAVLAGALWGLLNAGSPPAPLSIAVAAPEANGSGADSAVARRIQTSLMDALTWVPRADAVEASTTVLGADRPGTPVGDLLRRARRAGHDYLVLSSLRSTTPPTGLAVELWSSESDDRALRVEAGPAESLNEAATRLGYLLLRAIADGEDVALGVPRSVLDGTRSATALAHFVRGQRALVDGDRIEAAAAFGRAVAVDSTFAQAWFRGALAVSDPRDPAALLDAADAALRHEARMPDQGRALVEALGRYGRRQPAGAVGAFADGVGQRSDSPDAWFGLGLASLVYGGFAGRTPEDAAVALDRVLAIEPDYALAFSPRLEAALLAGDTATARAMRARLRRRRRPRGDDPAAIAARTLLVPLLFGDPAERKAAFDTLRWGTEDAIVDAFGIAMRGGRDLGLADSLALLLEDPTRPPSTRARGARYRFLALAVQERWDDALRARAELPSPDSFDAFVVLADLAGRPADSLARPMLARARRRVRDGRIPRFGPRERPADRERFRALVHAAVLRGDSADSRFLQAALRRRWHEADPDDPGPASLDHALTARLALLAGDTTGAIHQLEAALAAVPWADPRLAPLAAMAPERSLLARLLDAAGDPAAARRWHASLRSTPALGDGLFRTAPLPLLQ